MVHIFKVYEEASKFVTMFFSLMLRFLAMQRSALIGLVVVEQGV